MYPLAKEPMDGDCLTLEWAEANTAGRTQRAAFIKQGKVYMGAVVGDVGLQGKPTGISAPVTRTRG